jgi:hypothetical protein
MLSLKKGVFGAIALGLTTGVGFFPLGFGFFFPPVWARLPKERKSPMLRRSPIQILNKTSW